MINLVAKFLARPSVAAWLIVRAQRTPYTDIVKNGKLYMRRFWLFNPYPIDSSGKRGGLRGLLPSIRLHHILEPDQDRHLHDHPWDARTFILRGWYDEKRRLECARVRGPNGARIIHREAGETATLKFGEYHAITEISPGGVWTLFVTYRYRGTWGFLVDGVKVKWRTYLGLDK